MTCYGCKATFTPRHLTWSHLLGDWCCRGCVGDHKKLHLRKWKEAKSLASSNGQDTALVKPESQFESECELSTFNNVKFTLFQEWAGCLLTQEHAARVWKEVKPMLTASERMRVITAWNHVGDSNRSFPELCDHPQCEIDRVCNVIRKDRQKTK